MPDPIISVPVQGPKVTASVWGPCDEYIITGHENGLLCKWDAKVVMSSCCALILSIAGFPCCVLSR